MIKTPSIRKNFLWNGLLSASNVLFPLIIFPYASRMLQPASVGQVDFATSLVNYFIMFSALGIPTYGIRICAALREDRAKLSKTAQELFFINIMMTAVTAVFYIIVICRIPRLHAERTLFLVMGMNLFLNPLGMNWLYSAMEDYRYMAVRSIVFKLVSLILIFLLVHNPADYLKYAAIDVLAISGSNLANFFHAKNYISFKFTGGYHLKEHMKSVLVFFAIAGVVSVYTNLDVVMLGFFSGNAQVGYYSAALKIRSAVAAFVTILSTVLLPRLSYYAASGQDSQFHKLIGKSLNFALVTTIPLTVYFMVFSLPCIRILSGDGYLPAGNVLFCLMPSILFAGLTNVTGTQMLVPYNKEVKLLISIVVGAAVDFGLNLLLIPEYGAAGAATATSITEFFVFVVQLLLSKKMILSLFSRKQLLSVVMALCVSVAVLLFFKNITIQNTVVYLLLNGSVFIGSYFLCLILFKNPFIIDVVSILKR